MDNITSTTQCGRCNKYKGTTDESCKCGRPTDYSEEMLAKTNSYIKSCSDTEEDKDTGIKQKVNIPSIEGLAFELGVNKTTVYEWESNHEEFSNALGRLRAKQAKQLINKGLSGDYNPTIAKLLLSSHDYKEKSDVTSDGKAIKGNSIIFSNFKENE